MNVRELPTPRDDAPLKVAKTCIAFAILPQDTLGSQELAPATDSTDAQLTMIDISDTRFHGWLAVGMGLSGLVAADVLVVNGSHRWLTVCALFGAMLALAYIIGRVDRHGVSLVAASERAARPARRPDERRVPLWLLLPALTAMLATADTASRLGQPGIANRHVAQLWIASMALLMLAAWWHVLAGIVRMARARHWSVWPSASRRTWTTWIGMIAIAAAPRLLYLDRFPAIVDGDGAAFMVLADNWREGRMPNPFGTSFYTNSNGYAVVQGWIAEMIGPDIAGYRTLSALVGTIGVIATWRLGRYLVGPEASVLGAVILATLPLHVQLSRVALNNITDPTALVLALLFLLRAVRTGRRGEAVVCGVMLGLGFYGYYGGRAFPVVILVLLIVLSISRQVAYVHAVRLGGWIAAGFVATAMPLLMFFRKVPGEFGSHVDMVSSFTREGFVDDPGAVVPLYLENMRAAVIYPLVSNNEGWFRNDSPYLGWMVVIPMTVGFAVWVTRLVRDRDVAGIACLVGPWIMLSAGIALTTPIAGQRILAVTPFLALAAGSGIVLLARWMVMLPLPRRMRATRWTSAPSVAARMAIIAVLALAVQQVVWVTSDDRQIINYGDYRTLAASDIGWRFSHEEPGGAEQPSVLFAGAPFMYGGGWPNLRIQAPDLEITDVSGPILVGSAVPALERDAVLVIIAERSEERCAAEEIFEDATVAEIHARDGTLLYLALFYEPMRGWSADTTPAGTTFTRVATSPCPVG